MTTRDMVVKAKKAGRFSTDARYAGNRSVRQAFFLEKIRGKKKRPSAPHDSVAAACAVAASRRENNPAQIVAVEQISRRGRS